MPLNQAGLKSELISAYSGETFAPVQAQKTATAIANYWSTGISNLGGTVTSAASIPIMIGQLTAAWSQTQASPAAIADKVASAVDTGFFTIIIAGGAHGIGGIKLTVKPVLVSGLISAYSLPPTRLQHAQKFADAIIAYTQVGLVWGTGIPIPFTQPEGPLL